MTTIIVVAAAFGLFMIAAMWRVFSKAGKPGWAAIVPIYNTVVLLRVAGKPGWWFLLMFIPVVNIFVVFSTYVGLAKSFGKGAGFGVASVFFPFICIPILGFGSARYLGGHNGGQPPYPPQGSYPPPYPPQGQQYPQQYGNPYGQQPYQGQPRR
ncbi:DUF5684 domain-containing protein [Amycolatopsis pithecellobii]|uniref:DUF5684 domain-containing protein n=1 Tax=Amycolatopsis pithecellobii TaxID=664692 RepID=UPI001AA0621E|nr:DUF5684 domain-containing protein [Amycolatopsis pithecellobii]